MRCTSQPPQYVRPSLVSRPLLVPSVAKVYYSVGGTAQTRLGN